MIASKADGVLHGNSVFARPGCCWRSSPGRCCSPGSLIALANVELAEATFASFEVVIPLIAGLHAALLFAPDDEPALELLLAAPRPPVYLIYERLAALIGLQGGLALVLSVLAVITSPGANLLDLIAGLAAADRSASSGCAWRRRSTRGAWPSAC